MDVDLGMPLLPGVGQGGPVPAQYHVDWGGLSLSVFTFGLACCVVELVAATAGRDGRVGPATPGDADPARIGLLVVSGTVTDKVAPAVRRVHDAMPESSYVMSFGSCASSGGPYWDSYCVTKGVDQLLPVDVYVPGCPPRPEAFLDGLARLRELVGADR